MAVRRKLERIDLERMGVPATYWSGILPERFPPDLLLFLRRYAGRLEEMVRRPAGAYLLGDTGVGKTAAAILLLRFAREHGFTGYFTSVSELRVALRGRVMFDGDTTIWERVRDVDVLVLDGLRPEDAAEPICGAKELEEIVQTRTQWKRATFITSRMDGTTRNAKFPGLAAVTAGALVDVPVAGANLRLVQQTELAQVLMGHDPGRRKSIPPPAGPVPSPSAGMSKALRRMQGKQ